MADKLTNIDLRSEEVQDILTKVPHWMMLWGNMILLTVILLLLFISWFVKYPDIILSEAVITTEIPPQKEYAKKTGRLDALLVQDNEKVIHDQPLAVIENTSNYEDVFMLKSVVEKIRVNNKYFKFPIDSLPMLFLGDIETEYALFENSYTQYQLNSSLEPFSNEVIANTFSVSESKIRLQSLQSQKEMNKRELDFKNKDLQRNKTLFDKGVISAQEYENKQFEYTQAERNFKIFEMSISQSYEGISTANKTLKETEINQIKEDMVLLKNVLQSFNKLKKAIKDWEYQYVLKSKINGNVTFLSYWNTNQTVNAGDLVFTIIPDENSLFIAKLKTPIKNSGKIKVGQLVNIKLENYPDTEFGVLNGTVKNVSLVPDKDGFYLIDVKLPTKLITSYKKEIKFKQEMQGTAEIVTEDLRLIERLFYQFKEIVKR
ncbi:HlyD family efflux transporter periplasmic adaptor subunit [Flavobacterium sp. KS-LB2]|uniref:HlyD family secretion protein n=1 Tax=Flavobacterium sp. KS-LB2 TaxID=3120525 RepID=UPI0030D567E8